MEKRKIEEALQIVKKFRQNEEGQPTQIFGDDTKNNIGILNPFTMEHIVQNIVEFLNLKELQICRLVNSTWEHITLPYLKKKCKMITFNQDHSTYKTRHYKLEDMNTLIKIINNSRNFPYCKFDVETDLMENPFEEMTTEQLKIMRRFYKTVCPFVTELTIRLESMNVLYIGEMAENLVFSKLKVLNIQFNGMDKTVCGIQVIKRIIDNSPILDKISFEDYQGALDEKPESSFINLLANSKRKNISNLAITGSFNTSHVDRLSKMGLQLKSLYINLFGWNIDSKIFSALLKSQHGTLTSLVIEHRNGSEDFELLIKFPRMDKLTSFKYKKTFKCLKLGALSFSNISYKEQFPVLKCLSIESNMWEQFFGVNIQPVDTVEELVLNGRISNTDCLLHVARLFPKLKKLEIPANINVVNTVYNEMENIEELALDTEGVESVDDIITGLESDKCADMKEFQHEFNIKLYETKALSSLQNLKILRLKGTDKEVELSEIACRFLMEMGSLQCLDLCGRVPPKSKISDVLFDEMRKCFLVW